MVTHEMDIAEHATRIIRFKDGDVIEDRPVLERRIARTELEELRRIQKEKDAAGIR
jgi:putative ABC transport system ATP-binding protein